MTQTSIDTYTEKAREEVARIVNDAEMAAKMAISKLIPIHNNTLQDNTSHTQDSTPKPTTRRRKRNDNPTSVQS